MATATNNIYINEQQQKNKITNNNTQHIKIKSF